MADRDAAARTFRSLIHNVIAHPVLGITQTLEDLAEWFHDRTTP